QARLLGLHRDARTMIEEQGVNILYLALGQLQWMEAEKAESPRLAPLVLVPVGLARKTASDNFHLGMLPEDVQENLSLRAKLKTDFGIDLPPFPEEDDFDIAAYFEALKKTLAQRSGWQVLPDKITLGFFSFAKFLMFRDLDPENWPSGKSIADHSLLSCLLQDGFPQSDSLFPENAPLDEIISADRLDHVVDADSSQTVAIETVRKGRSVVIQGPPGTGKSQSISNIIATAVLDGKKVLFVAEKLAALEVVKRRLENEGLGDMCLELHSNKSNKRAVVDELARTWSLGKPLANPLEATVSELERHRSTLNGYVAALHQTRMPSELSPYTLLGVLSQMGDTVPQAANVTFPEAERWSPHQ
ncbi:MAG: DUF4011 domain-containing protein, partial [Chthoniobacteraceae bacterium]|nr:DUF4011 domain-containing protein [Chthoniobacteraceae bacterium]